MTTRIYIRELPCASEATEAQLQFIGKSPYYDLEQIPSQIMREEMSQFIMWRSTQVGVTRMYGDRQQFNKLCRFLRDCTLNIVSFQDQEKQVWIRCLRRWMLKEGIPLQEPEVNICGKKYRSRSRLISYLEWVLAFLEPEDERPEWEKDIWYLEKLDIQIRYNPVVTIKTLNFSRVTQPQMREELKRGIRFHLPTEALDCVQKEILAVGRLSAYLSEFYPHVQSCEDIDRKILEEYLIYLNTEVTGIKSFHSELTRLKAILNSIGQLYDYQNLHSLFLKRDIPPVLKTEFRTYSDEEISRINHALVKADVQLARLLVIHQMLGTRISDTLMLEQDCLYEKGGETIIRIRQVKTSTYEKPVSDDLAALIRKAIASARELYGALRYVFVDEKDPNKPLQYATVAKKIRHIMYQERVLDDKGNLVGFGSHMFRRTYGQKLTEMHLDDWTIAKLLGHSSVQNVKYYRKMSNQLLADETRQIRQWQSEIIWENLSGWEEEYVKIREDDSFK